jgi:hypothetical protein
MADITIIIRRERAFLIPQTPKGKKWVETNIIALEPIVSIQAELIEDMIKELQEAELSFEY